MPKQNNPLIFSRLLLLSAILICLGILIARYVQTSWNIFLAVIGFSAVVFIHECGHFFVAKAVDIRIEVFSIFLPPVLVGIRRTAEGIRIRFLPRFFPKDNDPDGDGLLSFTLGKPGTAGETEYRIGLIPVAGYVKMLGQEDLGPDKQVADPRSFGKKPIPARMAVIAAGVTFNVIAAVAIMTIVYLIGIPRIAPVVGGVMPGSPADHAGMLTGDRIVEIDGQADHIEYADILMASALSNKGQSVPMKVRRTDGTVESLGLIAETIGDSPIRLFGIYQPLSLRLAQVEQPEILKRTTGLVGGDLVVAINGRPIQHYWQLEQAIAEWSESTIPLQVERPTAGGKVETFETRLPLYLSHTAKDVQVESDLDHVCSMVPRLVVTALAGTRATQPGQPILKEGDIILQAADVNNPTFKELRDITTAHVDRDLAITVLRTDPNGPAHELTVTVRPYRPTGTDRVLIGISVALDAQHPIVSKTIATENGPKPLAIPRGATILTAADKPVTDFYDVIQILRQNQGNTVGIGWKFGDQTGTATVEVRSLQTDITVRPVLAEFVPFEYLMEEHKAQGLAEALSMGLRKSRGFVLQTYVTLKRLLSRSVSLEAMSGPVGIATIAYKAVEQSGVQFLYLLAFISANLAVVNFLPIPVVDGGVFVMLLIEKINGGPLSIRVQEIITYAGLSLIASLFLYLTYNDILRLILG